MKKLEIYNRICKKCGEFFRTYKKRGSVCEKCNRGLIWKIEETYPKIPTENKNNTDGEFINENPLIKLGENKK